MSLEKPQEMPGFEVLKQQAIQEIRAHISNTFGEHPHNEKFAQSEFESAEEHVRAIAATTANAKNAEYEINLAHFFMPFGVSEKTARAVVRSIVSA